MAKKKSKIKSALKKIGKAALVAGAGYAAFKGLKNRKKNQANVEMDLPKSDMKDYGPYSKGTGPTNAPSKFTRSKTVLGANPTINRLGDTDDNMYAAKGGRATKTKPKSIGKALRGGGKVMR